MYELHVSPAANIVLQSAAHIRQQQAKQGYSQMHNVKQKPQYNVTENIYVSNIAYAFFRRAAGIPPAREKNPPCRNCYPVTLKCLTITTSMNLLLTTRIVPLA